MWLVLCEQGDRDARWAYNGLRARGLSLALVTVEQLTAARRWEHRLGVGGVSLEIELGDGRTIRSAEIEGALNRLVTVPADSFPQAAEADREYAVQELSAFFLSWLASLPGPVLNRPTPRGLSGSWLERTEWLALAAAAGLPTRPYRRTTSRLAPRPAPRPGAAGQRSVIVVGKRALGPAAPSAVVRGCGRLARAVGASILGVDFDPDGAERWTFAAATPLPPLRRGGNRLLDLLAAALQEGSPRR